MKYSERCNCEDAAVEREEPPPFGGSWGRLYAIIALYTGALIIALYLVTVLINR